jgi:adenylate cyclase
VRRQTRERITAIAGIAAISAVLSVGFGAMVAEEGQLWRSMGLGAFLGAVISTSLITLEYFVLRRSAAPLLRRFPFGLALLLRTTIYVAVMLIVFKLAFQLFLDEPISSGWLSRTVILSLAFGAAMSVAVNFLQSINRMLGRNMLATFLLGRYHRPRLEQRIVMVLDLEGSTTLAERMGNVRFLEFLDRFFRDIAEPVIEHGGEIYKYLGDGVIVTWKPRAGLRDADALRCWFALGAAIERRAASYRRAFGTVPQFRAGLHLGEVVVGEMGEERREIAYLGDTVNTAARIEQACRDLNRRFLVSGDLLARLVLPPDIVIESLGEATLRGKEKPVALYSCTMRQATAAAAL